MHSRLPISRPTSRNALEIAMLNGRSLPNGGRSALSTRFTCASGRYRPERDTDSSSVGAKVRSIAAAMR